ncbi:MAG: hypothetical protein HYV02_06885 [Deltaproteobacteria bacterium]|nr:hypothetical protein [Deltaproteobacteria bacterium]
MWRWILIVIGVWLLRSILRRVCFGSTRHRQPELRTPTKKPPDNAIEVPFEVIDRDDRSPPSP